MSANYHDTRFEEDARRSRIWRALWRYWFRHRIGPDDAVLDLGAGYGDFINAVRARRRIAADQWDGLSRHVDAEVETIIGPIEELAGITPASINYAFASNIFEHLSQEQFVRVLDRLRPLLAAGGTLTILQPNYRYAFREYFDDFTHVSVYSHISLADFLAAHGWKVVEVHPRFLPLTVKSRLPTWDFLVGAYLRSPVKPMGKQMLLVARPGG